MNFDNIQQMMLSQRLETSQKMVLVVLMYHADENGYCYPSQKTIGREASLNRGTVNTCIKDLVEMGYIEKLKNDKKGDALTYKIVHQYEQKDVASEDRGCRTRGQGVSDETTGSVVPEDRGCRTRGQRSKQLSKQEEEQEGARDNGVWNPTEFRYSISDICNDVQVGDIGYPRFDEQRARLASSGRMMGMAKMKNGLRDFLRELRGVFSWDRYLDYMVKYRGGEWEGVKSRDGPDTVIL